MQSSWSRLTRQPLLARPAATSTSQVPVLEIGLSSVLLTCEVSGFRSGEVGASDTPSEEGPLHGKKVRLAVMTVAKDDNSRSQATVV